MDKLWVTLGGIVIPLGSLRPHALQLLPIGRVFQQHRPSSVVACGLYMGTSRQRYPGYGKPQLIASKLYGTSYKNVAYHDQGPCKETSSLSGKVRIRLHDFSMYAHNPPSQPCVVCYEYVGGLFYVKAPCGHIYDIECMTSLVRSATSDESLFPPRCCSRPIGYDLFNALIPLDVWKAFERASQEFSVTAKDRIYCPSPACSKFLGSVKALPRTTSCPTCRISVCTQCRKHAHPLRRFCEQEDETGALQGLLEQNRWQRCPNCRAVVELNQGCYHITCRCRSQFCYLCSAPWKTCSCRQWDERMLLAEAERRVAAQVQLGRVRPQPAPTAATITATPPPRHALPYANLNVQPERNNGLTNVSSEPRTVIPLVGTAARGSTADGSMAQRAGNSLRYESPGERENSPFGYGGHGYHSQRGAQSNRRRVEQGSSQGYQSHQRTQESPRDDWHQKRVKEMMERLRSDHDCNPHDWRKRNGGGKCSECHHHLPLYLLVSTSISR